jgi:hypothetical protein
MKYTGKLYGRIGSKFFDTGYPSDAVTELADTVNWLIAEKARLKALYEIAVGHIAWNSDDMSTDDVRKMIERHYEDELNSTKGDGK